MLISLAALITGLGFLLYLFQSSYIFWTTGTNSKPTNYQDIIALVRAFDLDEGDVFYDLGSGDGRVLFYATKNTGCRSIGYEKSIFKHLMAKAAARYFSKYGKITLRHKDILRADLSDADAIYCSLSTRMMKKLKPKFERELKNGVRIITDSNTIPGLVPVEVIQSNALGKRKLYKYVYQNDSF